MSTTSAMNLFFLTYPSRNLCIRKKLLAANGSHLITIQSAADEIVHAMVFTIGHSSYLLLDNDNTLIKNGSLTVNDITDPHHHGRRLEAEE